MITFCNPPYIYTKKNIVALKDHGGGNWLFKRRK